MTTSLRFLHIQKTGGSTLSSILRRQYIGRKTFFLENTAHRERLERLSQRQKQQPLLFLGHAFFITGDPVIDGAAKITLLREPVSRVISLCQHIYEGKESYLRHLYPPECFSLDQLLESQNLEFSNFQTRSLIDCRDTSFEQLVASRPAHEIVDQALENLLNSVLSFGLTNYFDESLVMFSQALNWQMPPVYVLKNTRNSNHILCLNADQRQRIQALNSLDIELYRRAEEHFLKRLRHPNFDTDRLEQFRTVNRAYQRIVHKVPPPTALPYPLNLVSKALR